MMARNLSKFFRTLDMYGTPIPIYFQKESKYKTLFGSVLTILSILIIIIFIIIFLYELCSKGSFTIVSSNLIDSGEIIDFSNIPFLFSLSNSEGEYIEFDEKLFAFSVFDTNYKKFLNANGKYEFKLINRKIDIERCDKIRGENPLFNYFSNYNLSHFMCIKPGQNLTMYGRFGDQENGYKGFGIYIDRCYSDLKNCYGLSYINKLLSDVKFNFLTLENGIDHYRTNNTNVFYEIRADGRSLSTLFIKKFYYSFKSGHYLIDNSILFNSVKQFNFFQSSHSYMDLDSDSYNSLITEHSLGYFAFNSDNNVIQYHKYYLKLSETLSSIGGCINIVSTITQFITFYLTNTLLFFDMIERLLLFGPPKEKNNNKIKIQIYPTSRSKFLHISEVNKVPPQQRINSLKNKKFYLFFPCCPKKKINNKELLFFRDLLDNYLGIEMIFNTVRIFNNFFLKGDSDNKYTNINSNNNFNKSKSVLNNFDSSSINKEPLSRLSNFDTIFPKKSLI